MLHGVATLLLGWALAAPGEAPSYRVALELTEGCEAGAVERQVDQLLSSSTVENTDVFAHGRIDQANGEYRLLLSISSGGSVEIHRLAAPSCAELLDAVGLLVASTIDPLVAPAPAESVSVPVSESANETGPPPDPAMDPVETPDPAVEPAPELERAPWWAEELEDPGRAVDEAPAPPEPEPGVVGLILARGGVGYGTLPDLDLGFAGGLGLDIRGVAGVEIGASHYVERRFEDQDAYLGAAIGVRLTTGTLLGCWRPKYARVVFPVCAGIELGAMRGIGVGAPNPTLRTGFWGAGEGRVGLRYPDGAPVALAVDAQGYGVFQRPAFRLSGSDSVYRAGPGGFRALVGMDVRLTRPR